MHSCHPLPVSVSVYAYLSVCASTSLPLILRASSPAGGKEAVNEQLRQSFIAGV